MRDMQQNIAESVLSFTSDRLLYAASIDLSSSFEANDEVLFVENGQLLYKRAGDNATTLRNVFGTNFYRNYGVSIICEVKEKASENEYASFTVTVDVFNTSDPGKIVATRAMTRPLLNYDSESKTLDFSDDFVVFRAGAISPVGGG